MGNCTEPLYFPQSNLITYVRYNGTEDCNLEPEFLHILQLRGCATVFLNRRVRTWTQLERAVNQWLDDLEPYQRFNRYRRFLHQFRPFQILLDDCCWRQRSWVLHLIEEPTRGHGENIGIHTREIVFKMTRGDQYVVLNLGSIFTRELYI